MSLIRYFFAYIMVLNLIGSTSCFAQEAETDLALAQAKLDKLEMKQTLLLDVGGEGVLLGLTKSDGKLYYTELRPEDSRQIKFGPIKFSNRSQVKRVLLYEFRGLKIYRTSDIFVVKGRVFALSHEIAADPGAEWYIHEIKFGMGTPYTSPYWNTFVQGVKAVAYAGLSGWLFYKGYNEGSILKMLFGACTTALSYSVVNAIGRDQCEIGNKVRAISLNNVKLSAKDLKVSPSGQIEDVVLNSPQGEIKLSQFIENRDCELGLESPKR